MTLRPGYLKLGINNGNPIELTMDERRQGTYIIGTTGTGKSTLLKNIIYQDNKSTNLLETSGRKSAGKKSRALNMRYFFLMDQIKKGNVVVMYCPTGEMIANSMT